MAIQSDSPASKTRELVSIPAAPQLLAAIEAMAVTGTGAFLITAYGKAFTRAGLGTQFKKWATAAGLTALHDAWVAGGLGASRRALRPAIDADLANHGRRK
jgi:hypothetical protein